jgi:uncharacterized RDD family membrane protein YckC
MDHPTPAALHWRLLALLYDLFPLIAIWLVTSAVGLALHGWEPMAPGTAGAWLQLAGLLATTFLYFALSWRRGGQTIGMRAWRLRLEREDGGAPTWPQLALRSIAAVVSMAAFGLGFLWSLLEPQRRTWHDIASRTRVLRLPPT